MIDIRLRTAIGHADLEAAVPQPLDDKVGGLAIVFNTQDFPGLGHMAPAPEQMASIRLK
jgi:hypothetical protein